MAPSDVRLRPATSDDSEFLRRLFFIIRAPEFEQAGLVGPQLDILLNQQYLAMRTHYDRVYPDASYVIFEIDGEQVGYQATIDVDTLHLIDISIMPEYRNQGLGTSRMLALQEHARRTGKPMTLTVEKFNPALRLYERLGFVVYDNSAVYQRMRWTPSD